MGAPVERLRLRTGIAQMSTSFRRSQPNLSLVRKLATTELDVVALYKGLSKGGHRYNFEARP